MDQIDLTNLKPLILATTIVAMIIGIIFTVVPPLPGTVIIWAAAVGYGLFMGWDLYLGGPTFVILTILMLIGIAMDIIAGHVGAKVGGASWLSITLGMILGLILTMLGSSMTPIVGCLAGAVGMIVSVFAIEWWRNKDRDKAIQAIKGYCAGTTLGMMAKVTTACMMMIIFLVRVFAF
ncbi:DUF456 domain-containing protein [Anaerolineales bacterium HSG25]|nr:DUF456 domain-containing protein [Anaerolineales bacterium HSG25]